MENMPSLPGRWEGAALPVSAAAAYAQAHGRGTAPRRCQWVLVCQNADNGYGPGDELPIAAGGNQYDGAPTAWANAAQAGLSVNGGLGSLVFINKSGAATFSITAANWKLKCYADF